MHWRPANLRALAVTAGFAVVLVALLALTGAQKSEKASISASSVLISNGQPRAGCTGVIAAVPPDDMPLIATLIAEYDATGPIVGSRCVDVRVLPRSAGEATDALARGWDEKLDGRAPQLWLPGASSWVSLVRAREANPAASVLPDSSPGFAQSPFVVAMPRPMAEALGWPDQPVGFTDLVDIGLDPAGWGKAGIHHPEWGTLRLGKTNPLISTTGLHALIAAYFAATKISTGDLTELNLINPKAIAFVKGVELATVHYGVTTSTFLANLQRADDSGASLSYVSAVALEERQVLAYNSGNPTGDPALAGKHAPPKVPLAAIYPKEGTLLSDNPFVVLNGAWVSQAQKDAAANLLKFLLAPAQQHAIQDAGYRDALGKAGSVIKPANGLLPGQPTLVIKPPPSSVLDKLQTSWWQVRKPARVLVVVDVSGSMDDKVPGTGTTKLGLVKLALMAALDQIGDADQVGLWSFSDQYQEVVPVGAVGVQRAMLKKAVASLAPGGGTLLYGTIGAGLDQMKKLLSPTYITAMVVLTDGADNASGSNALDDLTKTERSQPAESSVRVFTIAYGVDANRDVLREIAEASQASSYDASNPALIRQVFVAVLSNF
jgi:Ca-activated chloride channel family protein